ncbi:BREX-1 system adenine-specific DNA-methyltransferase PglX [Phascolarctobacterium succinatutens]|uniref:BREX-1 system adenine-specific DNA-methyltransferase PglX n=1 Tax=Phascolarctobacterium succinatutens TaxID=626940 RepID=UPI003AF9B578
MENNLYGLDIDKRAFQLAYFAVLMKARQYHKFILKKQPQCHIYAIAESNGINMKHLAYFGAQLDELARPVALNQMQELIATLHDAKEYGSIISVADYDWDLLHQFAAEFDVSGEMNLFDSFGIEATQQRLQELVAVGEVLAQKYEVVVTNPPYLGSSRFNDKLDAYVKEHFKDEKSDLSMVMYRQSLDSYSVHNGLVAFITTSSWMFLSSFEKLRRYIMQNKSFVSIVDFGSELFEGKVGHNVITSWITRNAQIDANLLGIRLVEYCYSRRNEKITEFHNRRNWHYVKQSNFAKIPGTPVAYWVSENVIDLFGKNKISDIASAKSGMTTTNNERFLRFWFEVEIRRIGFGYKSIDDTVDRLYKWFPFCKGGDFRRWAGNECYVVNWFNNGEEIRKAAQGASGGRLVNIDCALQKSIVWTKISSSIICLRYKNTGLFFSDAAPGLFSDDEKLMYILGLMNTKYAMKIINLINPTLNFVPGTIASIPIIDGLPCISEVKQLVKQNISLSKSDWDAFETSWDFTKHPLLRNKLTISEAYSEWEAECNTRFAQLKANEEELNRIFIDIYGLQDELTPEVEDKDVTVRKADLQRDIKSLLSYAVGCMFGRYSLDVEGLAYAGGEWDESKYVTFKPDEDNVIPITDEDYFEDDIIGRLIAWLKVVYGAETLEENLRFIADALGTSGDTARQKIRNYFLKDFFKDHCKIYQKRPIYWLYDSGRQNGFKALIYMHRYDADTSGQVRAEYLGKMEETYESEINRMQDIMDNGAGREVALAGKRKEKLQKQLHECRDYDAVLGHIALASIAIDLDDGVKVNYVKVQTAKDGKLLPILAKI